MRTLSKKSSYALRALVALARRHGLGPVLIAELAEKEQIPKKFLELVLLDLKNAGILQSKKGKGGGYALARTPDAITLGEVIRLFDGPLAPLPCASERAFVKCEECDDVETCAIRTVMKEVRDATARILDGTTLATLLRRKDLLLRDRKNPWMYQI